MTQKQLESKLERHEARLYGMDGKQGLIDEARELKADVQYLKTKLKDIDRKVFVLILLSTAYFGTDIIMTILK